MTDGPERIELLAGRVRWLDRNRRLLGTCAGVVGAPFISLGLSDEWPRIHMYALVITMGFVIWLLTEVVLAYLTAAWETECDQLTRDRGLPKAIVRK
jgi:hypothetical protein